MEALANKETAAKEKEKKQKQAVEDREKRRHQSGTDPWGQETELSCWGQKGPLMYQEKEGGTLCKQVPVLFFFFWVWTRTHELEGRPAESAKIGYFCHE